MDSPALRTLWIALVLGLLAAAGPPAWAGNDYCRPVVEDRLRALGVAEADVRRIQFYELTRGHDDRVVRREAFVWMNSCEGNIVMSLLRGCRILQVYTRGQCSVAGVKNC
jgi:hypothetical protein